MKKDEIMNVARNIRGMLCREFPDNSTLDKQCKRASILFDLYFKRRKVPSFPTTGFITKKSDHNHQTRGHVWTILTIGSVPYLLDITLTQFHWYLDVEIPNIIFMPYEEAKDMYGYRPDGRGEYNYHRDDVRLSLVTKVNKLS